MKELDIIKNDCLSCRRCAIGGKCLDGREWTGEPNEDGLIESRANVFSTMNPNADVMIVGQNPGADEVGVGEPFVGVSGKVFEEALGRIVGLTRNDLYITNAIKCYTKENRKPIQSEIENCRTFLDLELELVKPKVVVAIGSLAFKVLTGMTGIMKHCGEAVTSPRYGVKVIAMLHPSPYNMSNPERCEMFELAMEKLAEVLRE
jgi:uracil-DNA glycosylase family 4